jgi:hypothetical protein
MVEVLQELIHPTNSSIVCFANILWGAKRHREDVDWAQNRAFSPAPLA